MPSTSPESRKRFQLCVIFVIVFTALGFVSLSSFNTAASIDAYIDVEKYKTHLKGYIPSISGSLGLGKGKNGVPCDPNEQPGFMNLLGTWESTNPLCPGESFVGGLRNMPTEELWDAFPDLRNKSILFAGDSVGRHMFEWFCWMSKSAVDGKAPEGFEKFAYGGLTNTSDPYARNIVESWFPGGIDWDIQSRVERFFNTTLKEFKPDFVQLNSGPWDFRYWYLRDVIEKKRADDLALEDRETAAAMAVQTLDYFQRKWPGAKVWYMHPPMADEDDYLAKTTVGDPVLGIKAGNSLPDNEYPPFYTYRRQAQYRATMVQRLIEAGHDSLDYVKVQQIISPSRFFKPGDGIHPQEEAKWVMSNMILNKMVRYVRYGV